MLPIAASAIPVIIKNFPAIKSFLQSVVVHVESIFGGGNGASKLQTAMTTALPLLQTAAGAGKVPPVSTDDVTKAINAIVAELNTGGLLSGVKVPAATVTTTNNSQVLPLPNKINLNFSIPLTLSQ